ncbi:LolA family protein [Phenylobacterium sp.]|jgi:outer membrane lipoprotein-sorting protein|uniref:LolA family protein n=1 Tax=Phenylobacterium sp. TaxID=1871053 RepID=UPI002F424718
MSLFPPTRRALLAGGLFALAAPALAAPAPALPPQDKALVQKATDYLEGLAEAKGRFVQIDARGAATQGSLYLKRPGKARFAYDPPSGLLVVSDGGAVSIQNSRLKTFDSYPLMATPLSLFLAKRIRLDRGVVVTRVTRLSDGFSITARDGTKQAEGQITLTFLGAPMTLVGWTVADAQGQTTIRLSGLQPVSGLDPGLFVLKDPRPKNPGRGKT